MCRSESEGAFHVPPVPLARILAPPVRECQAPNHRVARQRERGGPRERSAPCSKSCMQKAPRRYLRSTILLDASSAPTSSLAK